MTYVRNSTKHILWFMSESRKKKTMTPPQQQLRAQAFTEKVREHIRSLISGAEEMHRKADQIREKAIESRQVFPQQASKA
jgi:hypothetical protein